MNKSLIFSAPHETTFANISPVIDLMSDSLKLYYLCQCNYYEENEKICEIISNNYELEVICLKNPFKFRNFYDPSFLHRVFIKLYVKIFLRKKLRLVSSYFFCPGGLLEGTVAKLLYKQGKKTIMVEGGFPLDLINGKKIKVYQKALFKYVKNHPVNNPLKYISQLIVSGEFSKELRIKNGYEESKIADIGVPRNIILFNSQKKEDQYMYDIIFLTGSFHFHGDYENSIKQRDYIKSLVEYSTSHKKKLLIKVHPRDKDNYESFQNEYVSTTHENLIKNIKLSKICLSFYSTAIYESIVINTDAYFVGQSLNNKWPENELIIHQEDFSILSKLLSKNFKSNLNDKKNIAYRHISKDSIYSAEKIKKIILKDVV